MKSKKIVYSIEEAKDIISLLEKVENVSANGIDLQIVDNGVPFYYDFEKKCLVSGTRPISPVKPDWVPNDKENYYYYDFDYGGPRSSTRNSSPDQYHKRIAIGNCFKHPKDITVGSLEKILKNLTQYHKLNSFIGLKK